MKIIPFPNKKPAKHDESEYVNQCRMFCYYRYEFFKRSSAYILAMDISKKAMSLAEQQGPSIAVFHEDILELAKNTSTEAFEAVKLDFEYNVPWIGAKTLIYTTKEGERITKSGEAISVFDIPYLMNKRMDFSVTINEILTIDRSIDQIKDRILKQFKENFPKEIGIPERMRLPNGHLASGKFLNFEKWKKCLQTYDKYKKYPEKSISDFAREIERLWPGHYDDPSNAHNKIKREIKEADRLIKSAARDTFPL
jgi:hypothetical protein